VTPDSLRTRSGRLWIRVAAAALLVSAATAIAAFAATRPDPATQAEADGCARSQAALFRKEAPTWAYVHDSAAPPSGPPPKPQWVHGVVDTSPAWLAAHPADVDDPVSHDSFDFLVNVKPDAADGALLGTGNFAPDGEQTGRLHAEWEEAAFPRFAWPSAGDRVALLGSWVWDCGHFGGGGERTELHPLRAVWVQRRGGAEADLLISTDKTSAGGAADCAHRTKGDRAAFKACLAADDGWQDVSGFYSFPLPTAGRFRVIDAGSTSGSSVRIKGRSLLVTVDSPPGRRVVVAKRILAARETVHLRVRFERILVRRAMDPGCTAPCTSVETTRVGQISKPPGEWVLYSQVAGVWSRWPLLRPVDGQTIALNRSVDVYLPRREPVTVLVTGRECDNGSLSAHSVTTPPAPCPGGTGEFLDLVGDDAPGTVFDRFASAAAAAGTHVSDSRLEQSSCPRVNRLGCYRITYSVAILPSR
jgi:hypothetical protein